MKILEFKYPQGPNDSVWTIEKSCVIQTWQWKFNNCTPSECSLKLYSVAPPGKEIFIQPGALLTQGDRVSVQAIGITGAFSLVLHTLLFEDTVQT